VWKYFVFAFKNSFRNKRRTLLTIASISVSLFLLGMLFAIYHVFFLREGTPSSALRLITRNRVSLTFSLPEYYEEKIRKIPGVVEVCPSSWFGGTYIDNRPEHFFARFPTDPDKIFKVLTDAIIDPEQLKAFQTDRTAAAVGKSLADRQEFKLGQKIILKGDIYPVDVELTIRAVFEEPEGEDVLYFNRKYLEESLPESRKGMVGSFSILTDSVESVPRIARQVDELFHNADRQTKTETERAFMLSFVSFLGNVKAFLLSICAAVVFTILLVSANTMAMSVRERTKEIGVLQTLGFTSRQVLVMIVAESVLIAMAGGLIGSGMAYLASFGLQGLSVYFGGFSIPISVWLASLSVAVAIGFFSSIVPAYNITRVPITEALRHVG
jgi:putative ABC transport system permease protein